MREYTINQDDPRLYEHLSLIIRVFERRALLAGTREGIAAVANSTLDGMQKLLDGAEAALNKAVDVTETPFSINSETDEEGGVPEVRAQGGIEIDADIAELMGGDKSLIANYLKDCIGCDLRLQFDWQLQPINLLGPLADMLADINAAIDQFRRLWENRFKNLEDLCDLLNGLNLFCIQDLIMLIMALKLLLKRYLLNSLDIKLDWTVLFGPLLSFVLGAIVDLIQQIAGILAAPIECIETALEAAAELESTIRSTAAAINQLKEADLSVGDFISTEGSFDIMKKDVTFTEGTASNGEGGSGIKEAPTFGIVDTEKRSRTAERGEDVDASFLSGFELTADTKLADALANPRFFDASWTNKLLIPVKEAKQYILDLVANLTNTLNSLKSLVSGGLSLELGNLGIMIFIFDMIALVTMAIDFIKNFPDTRDWCAFFDENPEKAKQTILNREERLTDAVYDDGLLILQQGPKVVGKITTCASAGSSQQNKMVQQWIQELKLGRKN